MANVINKTTLQYLQSVNTPDYGADWIINPILPDCEKKYWKVSGDKVVEMTAQEKSVVDTADFEAQKAAKKAAVKAESYRRITTAGNEDDIGDFCSLPEWKQRNYNAFISELLDKKMSDEELSESETQAFELIREIWDAIKSIRVKSDLIEGDIEECETMEELNNIDITKSTRWTE